MPPIDRPIAPGEPAVTPRRHATDWGLAGLSLGAIVLLVAPVLLQAALIIERTRYNRDAFFAGMILFFLGEACYAIVAVSGLVLAILGLRAAFIHKAPAGLPVAGLLASLAAMFVGLLLIIFSVAF